MNLTVGEYCLFNLNSKLSLLEKKGRLLTQRELDLGLEVKLYKLYDFHVELFWNRKKNKVEKIEPIKGDGWLNFYTIAELKKN